MGGFSVTLSPSPQASKDESDNGSGGDVVDVDDGTNSSGDEEMTVFSDLSFVIHDKKGEQFWV